jgi:Mor family transcriptional regulator
MDAEIISLYNSGLSIAKISKQLTISEFKIRKILVNANIEIKKHNYQKLTINIDEANKLYADGKTLKEIAEIYQCSDETIRNLIATKRHSHTHNETTKEKLRAASKAKWRDESYVQKTQKGTQTEAYKKALSDAAKRNYDNTLGKLIQSPHYKESISNGVKKLWLRDDYRQKQSVYYQERGERLAALSKATLKDPAKKAEWLKKRRQNNAERLKANPRISSTQHQLYYILEMSNITFHREGESTAVGPFYVVDCIIPKQQEMKRDLIIEVQGEYWHELKHVELKDRQKATYIKNHTDYDLLALKELDMSSFSSVKSRLAEFGITLSSDTFTTKDVTIKQITEEQAKSFYGIFHYTNTVRKGATTFGCYWNDKLVAAISYTYPIRQEIATSLKLTMKEVMEISRFARATNVECPNLGSFLISKSRKLLPSSVKAIISYSDAAYGHTGGLYKASGFTLDKTIAPDYHYESQFGTFHKKTIWDRAKRMKMNENEYAIKHGLEKRWTGEKTRWVFMR